RRVKAAPIGGGGGGGGAGLPPPWGGGAAPPPPANPQIKDPPNPPAGGLLCEGGGGGRPNVWGERAPAYALYPPLPHPSQDASHSQRCRTRCRSRYSDHSGRKIVSPHWAQ